MQSLNLQNIIKERQIHRPLIFHSVLWILAFVILLFIFSKGQTPITADYFYTVGFLIFIAIPVLINFYILIPKYLKLEKYSIYIILIVVNFLVFAFICSQFLGGFLDVLFSKYFFVSYLSTANNYLTFGIFLVATTLLKLAEDWFYFNTNENKLLKLQNQQIQTQLLALRAQINPHFLFNSLNVIYAMALEKKESITSAIVELSDVLRYVIYDSDTERVSLKDEIKLLQNYIAFQKHRGHSKHQINFKMNVENEAFKIYPMLLLPLLENAYKYGFSSNNKSEKIEIKMLQNASNFSFKIQNKNNKMQHNLDENYTGVGLHNLKNNLDLVYPNRHKLSIEDAEQIFLVTLKISDEQ